MCLFVSIYSFDGFNSETMIGYKKLKLPFKSLLYSSRTAPLAGCCSVFNKNITFEHRNYILSHKRCDSYCFRNTLRLFGKTTLFERSRKLHGRSHRDHHGFRSTQWNHLRTRWRWWDSTVMAEVKIREEIAISLTTTRGNTTYGMTRQKPKSVKSKS